MKAKKRPLKNYSVNVDMKWSIDVRVTARTESEARKKAWKKFKPSRKNFELLADKEF